MWIFYDFFCFEVWLAIGPTLDAGQVLLIKYFHLWKFCMLIIVKNTILMSILQKYQTNIWIQTTAFLNALWPLCPEHVTESCWSETSFSSTFSKIFFTNVKIDTKLKAEDNRLPVTGLSGDVLSEIKLLVWNWIIRQLLKGNTFFNYLESLNFLCSSVGLVLLFNLCFRITVLSVFLFHLSSILGLYYLSNFLFHLGFHFRKIKFHWSQN